jgi:hypothetical protein
VVEEANPPTGRDWTEWAREHKACFDVQPLVEVHKGQKVQLGFELSLYAELPMDVPPPERRERGVALQQALREILESVVTAEHPTARLDIEPPRTAAKLRPETGLAPEVELRARITRREESFAPIGPDARQGLAPIEDRLLGLGLRRGSWGSGRR